MTLEKELKLVNKAKTNVQAFASLYDYYFAKIFAFCINRLANKEAAEDVAGKTFLLAVEKIRDFDTSKGIRFGSWLYKVAHNQIIDHYRKNRKLVDKDFSKIQMAGDTDTEGEFIISYHRKQVAMVLKEMKPRYQEILTLKFYSELTNPEIAELMRLKPSQVAVILHRALRSFRKKFEKKFPKSEIFN